MYCIYILTHAKGALDLLKPQRPQSLLKVILFNEGGVASVANKMHDY